jgi:hypothetical protein
MGLKCLVQVSGPMGESALASQLPSNGSKTPTLPRPFFQVDFLDGILNDY